MDTLLQPGTILNGRYRIERVLGNGAFGRVYLAKDTLDPDSPALAIKELLDTQFSTPEKKYEAITWFKREVSALLTLEHVSIPAIYGYWTAHATAGPFYLAMEYIAGKTLETMLEEEDSHLPWSQVVAWGISLCDVLAYLHGRTPPFIFRDLKLSNVMCESGTDRIVLIDFGIARELSASGSTAIGTWGYSPYEQVLGKAEARSDLYALGATLHALLTLRHPDVEYTRLRRSGLDLEKSMKALFPPVDTLIQGIPSLLTHVIARATAFSIEDRFPDATVMAAELRQALAPSVIVSQHGEGQYRTITDAINNAKPGTRIEVQPGLYEEPIVIDQPVNIVGIGHADDIVIEAKNAACISMQTDDALLSGLTLRTIWRPDSFPNLPVKSISDFFDLIAEPPPIAATVDVSRGHLLLEDCRISTEGGVCVKITGGKATPIIRRCIIREGSVEIWGGHPTLEDCDIADWGVFIDDDLADPVIRRCRIHHTKGGGVCASNKGRGTVEDCDIFNCDAPSIRVGTGSDLVIRNCRIHDGSGDEDSDWLDVEYGVYLGAGVFIDSNGRGTIEDCDIFGHAGPCVTVSGDSSTTLRRCRIHHSEKSGVVYTGAGRNTLLEDCNVFSNARSGVEIWANASAWIETPNSFTPWAESTQGSVPRIINCRINHNRHTAIHIRMAGAGIVENCDLTGNTPGAWQVETASHVHMLRSGQVRRSGNRE